MMRRLLIPLALILAATNLFGQTEAQGPNHTQKPKPEGNCTVSGRVVSAADGSPLKSARALAITADRSVAEHIARAKGFACQVADAEEKAILEGDLSTIPNPT